MVRDRNDQGRYADGIDPETVLDVFDTREDRARPVTASDVVDELGIARRTAHNKLNRLVERGVLETRKVGARGRVWWVPIRDDATEGRERAVTPSDAHTVVTTTESETPATRQSAARDDDAGSHASSDAPETAPIETDQDLVDALRDWFDDGDHPPKTAHARDAVIDVFSLLREQGTLSTGELKERVYERHSEHYADKKPMWDSFSPYLTDVPGIEKAGYGKFGYAGDDATRDALKDD